MGPILSDGPHQVPRGLLGSTAGFRWTRRASGSRNLEKFGHRTYWALTVGSAEVSNLGDHHLLGGANGLRCASEASGWQSWLFQQEEKE